MDKDIKIVMDVLRNINMIDRDSMRLYIKIKEESKNVVEYMELFNNEFERECYDWIMVFWCVGTKGMLGMDISDFRTEDVGQNTVVIWNSQGCKLNGWRDTWLYPCVCNKTKM